MTQVILDKRRNKKVSVIVAFMATNGKRLFHLLARRFQRVRIQLPGKKRIGHTLIDQNGAVKRFSCKQFSRIVLEPRRAVITKIPTKGFLAPGTTAWRTDWRERGQRTVLLRIAQRQSKRTVSTH